MRVEQEPLESRRRVTLADPSKRKHRGSSILFSIQWVRIASFACLVTLGPTAPALAAEYRFIPEGCDYGVEFPTQPQIKLVIIPEYGEVPEAEIDDYHGLIRATCISPSGFGPSNPLPLYRDRQLLLDAMQAYMETNGLTNVSFSHRMTKFGIRVEARGYKKIHDRWVTYVINSYVSSGSAMFLTAGNYSERYPTAVITSFLNSIFNHTPLKTISSSQQSFVTVRLPFEVSVDIPRDWWILDETMNNLIHTSRDAILDLRGISTDEEESVLIAANSWPPVTYAALRVTRVRLSIRNPEDVYQLSEHDLLELTDAVEEETRNMLEIQGIKFLETTGLYIDKIDGWPALVFSYRRSGLKGPVMVHLIQLFRISDLLRINLSYREDESALWKPVIGRIRQSVRAG